jgi:hypothetical protein
MILTKTESIETKVGLWAIPKTWELQEGEFPFSYELYGFGEQPTHWSDTAIFLKTVDIGTFVPGGIDLFAMCIETLDIQARDALDRYNDRMEDIEKRRAELRFLTYQPAPPVTIVDGVEVLGEL